MEKQQITGDGDHFVCIGGRQFGTIQDAARI
jgi:hypothetical protein